MPAKVLDGKAAQAEIKAELTVQVAALRERGVLPGLGTILVGDDPASQNYVRMKHGDCQQVGIASVRIDLPGDASPAQLHEAIEQLNADPAVTGTKDIDSVPLRISLRRVSISGSLPSR